MWTALLLAGCLPAETTTSDADHVAAIGGPVGDGVPTNAVPWVVFPADPGAVGTTGAKATAGITDRETRAIKLVDGNGKDIPAERVVSLLSGGVRVQVVPSQPLKANMDYRLMVPGALIKAFRTGSRPDTVAPHGGEALGFGWERSTCSRLQVHHAPVRESGPVFWEVEAVGVGGTTLHAMGERPPTAPLDQLELRACEGALLSLPAETVRVRLRWVDLAGNATEWSRPMVVAAGDTHAAGEPEQALSAAP